MDDRLKQLRSGIYWLLIITVCGAMVGRIWTVRSGLGKTPLLSANDRSRWCTIRALVDHGTYAIDEVIFRGGDRQKRDREWYTIDMVRHRGWDGREHFYSSKPPLFPTLLAGQYWLLQKCTGATLQQHPFYVVRCMLVMTNVVPLALYFIVLSWLVERYGTTDWGRVFVMSAATWGTFLTTYAVTLNNHLPAAVSVLFAVYAALRIWNDGCGEARYFVIAGLFSALAAANELPALSFLALLGGALLWKSPLRTCCFFVPAAALVLGGFFLSNYAAHGSWRPPYAHRSDGRRILTLDVSQQQALRRQQIPQSLARGLADAGQPLSEEATVAARSEARWVVWDPQSQRRFAVVRADQHLEVRQWDNWYEYDESYWLDSRKKGVDRGEVSRLTYAVHVLIGHHGLFSLTPIWLLSLAGLTMALYRRDQRLSHVAALTVLLSVVCIAFYIARPEGDRNYGGITCGFRWLFWLIPLWLIGMLPATDQLAGRRVTVAVCLLLLLVSCVSAGYASLNPWSHPWLYTYWQYVWPPSP